MGNPKAFLTIHRQEAGYRPIHERIGDFTEVEQTLNSSDRRTQASRCMDCGIPFCHWACPIDNKQPEWQDFLYKGKYKEAFHAAERFPINPPQNKEEYYYRTIFEEHFPSESAARSVPSVPSVACSTAEALAWDNSFKSINDPSGRAVKGVHESAY